MKQIIYLSLFLTVTQPVHAQETRTVYRNNVQLNTGYTLYDGFSGGLSLDQRGINRFTTILSYDGFPTERFSIGAFGGFTTSYFKEDSVYYSGDWWDDENDGYYTLRVKERRHFIGVKASTYFINTSNLQVYFGVGLAVGRKREYIRYGKEIYTRDSRRMTLIYDLHFGGNYYFNEHLGATISLGYPLAAFRVGLSYRY